MGGWTPPSAPGPVDLGYTLEVQRLPKTLLFHLFSSVVPILLKMAAASSSASILGRWSEKIVPRYKGVLCSAYHATAAWLGVFLTVLMGVLLKDREQRRRTHPPADSV